MMSTKTILARILFFIYLAAIAFLCFMHVDKMPEIQKTFLGIPADKAAHFLMFLPFPFLSYFAIGKNPSGPWKAIGAVLLIFLAGCLIAAGTELGQGFFPYRSTDAKDFLADACALALGSLAVFIIMLVKGVRSSRTNR